ncbi:MAG TPA: sugar phosphate isomerase/epimerase [Flavisolibacter sp.]|jgi:sugar phosphate isomerase/epimerase|nr:sugar phosphate isomerase/epimerase [Flavisolibacter sp.]
MKQSPHPFSRRTFIQNSAAIIGGSLLLQSAAGAAFAQAFKVKTKVVAHLWLYASKYPPNWDSYPDIETVFADLSYAGMDGVELMESVLRHDDAVEKLNGLIKKYGLPVSGTSYGVHMNMWNADEHKKILDDIKVVVPRLAKVGGKTFGISVGEAKRLKTEKELDAQAEILRKVLGLCKDNGIEPNLHNHTYEVEHNLHDLKGTIARMPDIKLGPDINWLIRAGVDPVDFIDMYGKQIVYLHIRDQYANGTWTEYLGQGATDFKAIAAALKRQKFRGRAAVELAFPKDFKPTQPLKEDWKLSRQYVKETFGW